MKSTGKDPKAEPIAIIGMGCRYPQAVGVEALWQLLVGGEDAIRPYPGGRFRELDEAYAQTAAGHGPLATSLGGFLYEIDRFDASFFGISPREAEFIDPQQRLLLEVSWNALEDAGQTREQYQGSRTGVFTGLWTTEYEDYIFQHSAKPEFYLLTGGGRSTACGRISFTFGFEGPSISVDTACSSSMVAVHLACQSLRQRECDMALAGGVNVILSTNFTRLFTNAGMLSPDGHCKFGDRSANGFVRSEGAGMIVLKRLADAEAAGDAIYAVIRGSAVNNDGRSSGLLVTPSREGQRLMLEEAWRQASIRGTDLSYIEAHGTGTHVGDPVEVGAICDALQADRARRGAGKSSERVLVGSMKSNIGHTESAAGVAGIIKTALVLSRGMIPASLHHREPNPEIDWTDGPIQLAGVNTALPYRSEGVRRFAAASSFGMTGTNAHIVLEEYVAEDVSVSGPCETAGNLGGYFLPVSGHSEMALRNNCRNWLSFLENRQQEEMPGDRDSWLAAVCWRAGQRRTHLTHRFAAVGSGEEALRSHLRLLVDGETPAEVGTADSELPRVVFVAPGQGSQWDGMARDLLRESSVFRDSFALCDRAILKETGWSLRQRLDAPEAAEWLKEIDFVQPALFAMSVGLAAVWQSVGVKADAIVGHSMGEVAAAYLCGALSLEEAAAVICRRSRLMRTLSGAGAMASVEMPAQDLSEWIEPFGEKVSIAAMNSPGTTVISGDAEAIDQVLEWLELKEIFCRRIKVDVASHSSMVDPILVELREELKMLRPGSAESGTTLFYSTVNGRFTEGSELDAGYWVRNLREPVRLSEAIRALGGAGYTCFVELSPHPILTSALEACLRSLGDRQSGARIVLPSLLRGQPASPALLQSIGRYWSNGGQVQWGALTQSAPRRYGHMVQLPEYAFDRERFWPQDTKHIAAAAEGQSDHGVPLTPLLHSRRDVAGEPGTTLFTVDADPRKLTYLADHRVGGAIVFPAAGYVEAMLEVASLLMPGCSAALSDVSFLQALYLSTTEPQEIQLMARRVPSETPVFNVSVMGRQGTGEGGWTEHCTGIISMHAAQRDAELPAVLLREEPANGRPDPTRRKGTAEQHYRMARRGGLEYGPAFQRIESFESTVADTKPTAKASIRWNHEVEAGGYLLHPALLDNCFQTMMPLRPRLQGLSQDDLYLPLSLKELRLIVPPSEWKQTRLELVAEARYSDANAVTGTLLLDLELRTAEGRVLVVVEKMTVRRVKTAQNKGTVENLFAMDWTPIAAPVAPTPSGSAGKHWLIFADEDSVAHASMLVRGHSNLAGRCTVAWRGNQFRALEVADQRLRLLGADEYELPLEGGAALDKLLQLVTSEAGRISDVVNLWTLGPDAAPQLPASGAESPSPNELQDLMHAQAQGVKFVPALVQAITRAAWNMPPKLWLMTRGTQNVAGREAGIQLAGATVWGLGATVAKEHPELRPVLVDMSTRSDKREVETLIRLISASYAVTPSGAGMAEDRFALLGEQVFAARFIECAGGKAEEVLRPVQAGEGFCVETERPGALDQLQLRAVPMEAPGPGEVAIEVAFAGLNFIDVTKALGIYPGLEPGAPVQMGGECSGCITAVGAGVEHLHVGDEVIALTPSPTRVGLLVSHAVVPATLVVKKPDGLSLAEAAGLPIAYLTAHYSLVELARIEAGEWVLIHAGGGGVGLAAARIAIERGARVIATASSPEKHAFLRAWGVEHVLPSRSLEFAQGVLAITGGRGVDVVLNSLAGDFLLKSLEVLAPWGRFVELGKRDIYEDRRVGLKVFRNNIAYFAVDLAALIEHRQPYAARMLQEVMTGLGSGKLAVLPTKTFSSREPAEVFQYMAQGRHIGKLVLAFAGESAAMPVHPPRALPGATLFRRDATYILTGALGGVGSAVAEWMAANGAGELVLVSRRAAGIADEELMQRVRAAGAMVRHSRVDLLDAGATRELIEEIGRSGRRLRGVMHAAAVIDDALIMDVDASRFNAVLGPKVTGTWNLHDATLRSELDFFMLFSSFASIFPQPGHGTYAAANSFMDAFAGYRRERGLAACSINWAGWLGLGLAKESGTARTIEASEAEGLGSFDRDEALYLLGEAVKANPVQAAAVRVDMHTMRERFEMVPPLFRGLAEADAHTNGRHDEAKQSLEQSLSMQLREASQDERIERLMEFLRLETGRVLRLAPEKVPPTRAFGQLGIDSLMALELIRRVNASTGLALPATAVFNYPTVVALSGHILKRLGLETLAAPASIPEVRNGHHDLQASHRNGHADVPVDDVSEEEALRALMTPGDDVVGR